ncbi:MAG: 1,4-dihydroxy-2-naphthoate octaprenyltransferase [Flavobacteriaceae bacterium]
MMGSFNAWILASRLRTLPLSLSGILIAAAIAMDAGFFIASVFAWSLVITILLQILSNVANDYGDGVKGTDNEFRIGPKRAMQSGLLSAKDLKRGMSILVIFTLLAIWRLFVSADLPFLDLMIFVALGFLALLAAIAYTVGKRPYGYRGWGDVMVFLFFGGVSVIAGSYLYIQTFSAIQLLFALSIGLYSTSVLNLNNLRDSESDALSNKMTLVVRMGYNKAIIYHHVLLIVSFVTYVAGVGQIDTNATLIAIPAALYLRAHLKRVRTIKSASAGLDPELKRIALFTFFSAVFVLVLVGVKLYH